MSDPRLAELCQQIRCAGTACEVPLAEWLMEHGNCYWNALVLTQSAGGSVVFGWMIVQWPGLYLSAQHHAVWQSPSGELTDVTRRMPAAPGPTTFVRDSHQTFDLNCPPNIGTRYLPLSSDDRVSKLIGLSGDLDAATTAVNSFISAELQMGASLQMAIARGDQANRLHLTPVQLQKYRELLHTVQSIRGKVGAVIQSLIERPPNRIARLMAM